MVHGEFSSEPHHLVPGNQAHKRAKLRAQKKRLAPEDAEADKRVKTG
ncbi:hypothetical protein [Pyxidicoccus caerfyrddinensis]|nr:hypothetical protein [Pyxidicoccus caerfyrddinensis]